MNRVIRLRKFNQAALLVFGNETGHRFIFRHAQDLQAADPRKSLEDFSLADRVKIGERSRAHVFLWLNQNLVGSELGGSRAQKAFTEDRQRAEKCRDDPDPPN